MTVSTVFTTLSRMPPLFPNTPAESAFPSTTSVRPTATFVVLTVPATVLSPCSAFLTTRPGTSTRVVANARAVLQCTWNHGTPISWLFSTYARTTATRVTGPAICSTRFGSPTCSWNGSRATVNGHSFALTNVPAWPTAGARSLSTYTPNTRRMVKPVKPCRLNSFGLPFSIRKLKRVRRTCFSRTRAMPNPINKISVRSSAVTCARRLSNTRRRTKRPCAI
jgi:hypothetical protein